MTVEGIESGLSKISWTMEMVKGNVILERNVHAFTLQTKKCTWPFIFQVDGNLT